MFSTTLAFTTLFASFAAVSAGTPLVLNKPAGLVQCANTKFSWTGGEGPYDVYVFTTCNDPRDDPIATFTNVTGTSVDWWVSEVSGSGVFVQLEDATGDDVFSDDSWIGGDADKAKACAASVSAVAATSTQSATSTSASGSVPTTMSNANAKIVPVANAANGPSSSSGPVVTGSPLATPNGASSLTARPIQVGAGLLAVAFAASML